MNGLWFIGILDRDPSGNDDDIRVDDGDNVKLNDSKAAKTEDIAIVHTDSKAAQAKDDAGSKEHAESNDAAQVACDGSGRNPNLSTGSLAPAWLTPEMFMQFLQHAQAQNQEPPVEAQNNNKRKKDKNPNTAVIKKERAH